MYSVIHNRFHTKKEKVKRYRDKKTVRLNGGEKREKRAEGGKRRRSERVSRLMSNEHNRRVFTEILATHELEERQKGE